MIPYSYMGPSYVLLYHVVAIVVIICVYLTNMVMCVDVDNVIFIL